MYGYASARDTIAQLVDPGAFRETDARLSSRDPLGFEDDLPYAERLRPLVDALIQWERFRHSPSLLAAIERFKEANQ